MIDLLEKEFITVFLKMLKDLQEDTGKTMYEQKRQKRKKLPKKFWSWKVQTTKAKRDNGTISNFLHIKGNNSEKTQNGRKYLQIYYQ